MKPRLKTRLGAGLGVWLGEFPRGCLGAGLREGYELAVSMMLPGKNET
jgi:hypothetical protein